MKTWNAKPGEVVFAIGVKVRHLGCFSAEKYAAVFSAGMRNAIDDRCCHIGLEFSGRKIMRNFFLPKTPQWNSALIQPVSQLLWV